MNRLLLTAIVALLAVSAAVGHFVYVVPAKDAKSVEVVFSDDLEADEGVPIEKIAKLTLTATYADGSTAPLEIKQGKTSLTGSIAKADPKFATGKLNYGLSKSGANAKLTLLVYHPKVVFAGATGEAATAKAELEVVPVTIDGKTKFQLLAKGKPVTGSVGSLIMPDGTKAKLKTDDKGFTDSVTGPGRYAVWLRHVDTKAGEVDGQKKYDEAKHYATLVVDVK